MANVDIFGSCNSRIRLCFAVTTEKEEWSPDNRRIFGIETTVMFTDASVMICMKDCLKCWGNSLSILLKSIFKVLPTCRKGAVKEIVICRLEPADFELLLLSKHQLFFG